MKILVLLMFLAGCGNVVIDAEFKFVGQNMR